ncbi:hypothetical protein C0J52_17767 [Blattella germanica]|nr:hypothetical protein C0J52_17767 [Blattella germanica]
MLMHTLKFNLSPRGIDQSSQTAWYGIHGLLEDIVDDILNPCFQLFQYARFCPVHLNLLPSPIKRSRMVSGLDYSRLPS